MTLTIYVPPKIKGQLIQRIYSTGATVYSKNGFGGKTVVKISLGSQKYSIEYEGDIILSDDDKDIIDITRDGFIQIKKTAFGGKRKLFISSEGKGKLDRRYYVDGRKKEYEPNGRIWLSEILPEVIRSIPFGAENRVNRFYKKGGTSAVLDEVQEMESDYMRSIYLGFLLDRDLSAQELTTIIKMASQELNSDHYLSEILKKNQAAFFKNQTTITAYLKACKELDSDHYLLNVLKKIIRNDNIASSQMTALLQLAKNISSDHYLTEFLTAVLRNDNLKETDLENILKVSSNINSSHYKTIVLKEVIKNEYIEKTDLSFLVNEIKGVASDHYKTEIILELAKKKLDNKNLSMLIDITSNSIASDHYATTTIKKIIKNRDLTNPQLLKVLTSIKTAVQSDHYLTEILLELVPKVNASKDDAVRKAYRTACRELNSETYFGRAMRPLE